ncbi:hypothetical protein J6590_034589 [Homalodisca vitripennis]|nr:hypothetical protein J6590_034589 [Homalodisca vitripennis]
MKRQSIVVPLIAAQRGDFLPTLSACEPVDTLATHSCMRPENNMRLKGNPLGEWVSYSIHEILHE